MAKSLPVQTPRQKAKRTPLERAHQQFNKLVKEIADQEQRNQKEATHADLYHRLYQQKVLPLMRQYAAERLLLVQHLDGFFYHNKFSKSQSRTYLTWAVHTLNAVAAFDADVAAMLELKQQELHNLLPKRNSNKKGRDVDAVDVYDETDITDDDAWAEEAFEQSYAYAQAAKSHPEEHVPDIDDIGPLYKELAKKIHPDLEQDEDEKQRKHALMQQLTEARKNRDLYTLLRIKGELFSNESSTTWPLHQLKRFNRLLQEKLQQLQQAQVRTLAGRMMTQGWNAFGGNDPEQDINREIRELKKTIRAIRDERTQINSKEHVEYLLVMIAQADF